MAAKRISVEIQLRTATEEYRRAMAAASKSTSAFTKQIDVANKRLEATASRFRSLQGGVIAFAAATAGVQRALSGIVQAGLEFNRLNSALTVATGSAAAARSEYVYLTNTANDLGVSLKAAGGPFAQFAAAAKGTTIAGQGTREVFEGVSTAAVALGLSADQTQGTFRALTQIMSKGKVQAEELVGQLGERIPGALSIAARGMDVTTAELYKLLKAGQVFSDEFLRDFAGQMKEDFAEAAKIAAEGPQAAFNRLDNAVVQLQRTLADSGLIDFMADLAIAATKAAYATEFVITQLNQPSSETWFGQALGAAKDLGDSMVSMIPGVGAINAAYGQLSAQAKAYADAQLEAANQSQKAAEDAAAVAQKRATLDKELSDLVISSDKLRTQYAKVATAAEAQSLRTKQSAAQDALRAKQTELREGLRLEQDYARQLADLRRGLTDTLKSDEDRLREIRRKGMDQTAQQADIAKQAAAKISAARAAMLSGDAEQATTLAEEAKALAERLENTRKSERLYKAAADVYVYSEKRREQALEKAAAKQARANETTKKEMEENKTILQGFADAIKALTAKDNVVKIDADIKDAEAKIAKLQAQLDKLGQTSVKPSGPVTGGGFATGGTVRALTPGMVRGPGTATSDSILAKVSAGEHAFVTRAARAKQVWPLLNALNFGTDALVKDMMSRLRLPPGLANISRPSFASAGSYASGGAVTSGLQPVTINLGLTGGQTQTVSLFGERAEIDRLQQATRQATRGKLRA